MNEHCTTAGQSQKHEMLAALLEAALLEAATLLCTTGLSIPAATTNSSLAHLRCYARGIWSIDQLIRSSAPHIDRPYSLCFLWGHQLRTQIKRLGIACCDDPTSVVRLVKTSRSETAGHLQAVRMILMHLYAAVKRAFLHFSATQLSGLQCLVSAGGRT